MSQSRLLPPSPASARSFGWTVGWIGLLLLTAIALRWPGLEKQVWNLDEGSTFTMAQIVRDGGVLYRDAADNRTPLVPYAKALILTFTGDWNIRSMHLALAAMLGLTAVWIWRIGRAAGDEATGLAGAAWFTLLSFVMLTVVDTMSAHTGWFLIFFSGLGMWAFVVAWSRDSAPLALLAGSAFALAALAKQPGLLDAGVCIVICLLGLWTDPGQWRKPVRLMASLIAGLGWPLIATYAFFSIHGAWDDFLRYAWNYNTQLYVPEVPALERLYGIRVPFLLAAQNAPFALLAGVGAAIGLLVRVVPPLVRRSAPLPVLSWLILGWSASGLASTVLSGRDFAHYSIQILPGLSLAGGWLSVQIWRLARLWRPAARRGLRTVLGLGLASLVATAVYRTTTFDTRESLSQDIGRIIQVHTQEDERIFVWGYEPELHVFAQRLPSTRFVYAVFLTGLIPWTNLDPLQDTRYAIVPGSWDDFWRDFNARPPAMIIDTRGNRGFLKYPLRDTGELWQSIERDYVEVTNAEARGLGYALYRRTADLDANARPLPPVSETLALSGPTEGGLDRPTRLQITPPQGTTAVTLFVKGEPYRRVTWPPHESGPLVFHVAGADLGEGRHRVQAAIEGSVHAASPAHELRITTSSTELKFVDGPAIILADQRIAPLAAEAFNGEPLVWRESSGQWFAHAPAKMVYARPPELATLEFSFGISADAYTGRREQKTDGVEVIVSFANDQGAETELYRRRLDPVERPADRGMITGHLVFPGMESGRVTFLVTPGPRNSPAFDWTLWSDMAGARSPMHLLFRQKELPLIAYEAALGMSYLEYAGRKVLLNHAPTSFSFKQEPGMSELAGEFGLLDSAWHGPVKSAGAIFEVEQVRADGNRNVLLSRTLLPATTPADRGVQSFRVAVPPADRAVLRFVTRPADAGNNAFNHTFWHGLVAADFIATLPSHAGPLHSLASNAPHGLAVMDEEGRDVLFAHAPSEMVFPLPPEGGQLTGEIGLIRRAYTDGGQSDGVVFTATVEYDQTPARELYRRHLNPSALPADRGSHGFAVTLPAGEGARLILRTAPAPDGRLDYTWGYWHGLSLAHPNTP